MSAAENTIPCFKAYDIRGRVPDELDAELAYWIGQAYAQHFSPASIAIGHDIRLSGPGLVDALAQGLMDAGVDVVDIGLCGTEEIYFSAFHLEVDGGIVVTASHNPANYNGMKMVRKGAVPVSGDSGLKDIEKLAIARHKKTAPTLGSRRSVNPRPSYIQHLLGYIDHKKLKPLKLVVNAGNGCAGPIIDALENSLPFSFVKLQHQADGSFPNGVPNPLLPENRTLTGQAVIDHGADMGIAWDGDFDRCFLFDENGSFIEGYYMVGLLAQAMLKLRTGAKIIHDPRLTWNTIEVVKKAGGVPIMSKTGHAFIKERMRSEDAAYGGEMSAHHYFKDFSYCDSGMIPWLLVAQILSSSEKKLSELVSSQMAAYPVSGEINSTVSDPDAVLEAIERDFGKGGHKDYTDGLSVEFDSYRFNLRKSNTEPVIRLNVESRADQALMEEKTKELLDRIRADK
nr:phosphomannomutase [Desulfobulbaceae bacterium]